MDKVFVDTSGWIALFLKNDDHHAVARRIYRDLTNLKVILYTSDYVIDETITTILAREGKRKSIQIGDILFSSQLLITLMVAPQYLSQTWDLYRKYHDKNFSFTDASSLALMSKFGISKMFSFDREFGRIGIDLQK